LLLLSTQRKEKKEKKEKKLLIVCLLDRRSACLLSLGWRWANEGGKEGEKEGDASRVSKEREKTGRGGKRNGSATGH